MTYVLSWTNPAKTPITLADSTADNSTSLTLTGKGYVGWGKPLQQNLIRLLENFASSTAPSTFTLGQLWYNSNIADPRLKVSVGASDWLELAYRRIDSLTFPTISTYPGDTWYDTTHNVLNVYGTLAPASAAWNQLAYTVQTQGNYSTDSGTVNNYVVTLTPSIIAYANNFTGAFKVANANTGASTLNAGGGAVPLVTINGGSLSSGDLPLNAIVSYLYVHGDNVAYVTSVNNEVVQSQTDARYAKLAGLSTQTFEVATAVDPNDAVPFGQANSTYAPFLSGVPTGTIIDYAGTTPPAGFIQCPTTQTLVANTDLIPGAGGTTYNALWLVVGTRWGGSGASSFSIPYFPAFYAAVQTDNALDIGTSTNGVVIAHTHTYNTKAGTAAQSGSSTPCWVGDTTATSGVTGGAANLAAGMLVMKCVKY